MSEHIFEVRERVVAGDLDAFGNIQIAAFVRFVDSVEAAMYARLGIDASAFESLGVQMPRVHVAFDFFSPVRLGDEVVARAAIKGVGAHSVRIYIEFLRADEDGVVAEAHIVSSAVDRTTRRSTALPERVAKALRAELPEP